MLKKLFLLLCAVSLFGAAPSAASTLDKVIVIVNTETITQGDLDTAMEMAIGHLQKKYKGDELAKQVETQRQEILNRMVEEKLILSEAKKRKMDVDPQDIEERLNEVKAKFESEHEFSQALKEGGVSLNDLKLRYVDQIRVERLVDDEVRKKLIVRPSEILNYYNAHQQEFRDPQQIKVKNILIKIDEDTKTDDKARELSENILGFIRAGESFDDLALKYSKGPNADRGGDMGFIKKGQMLSQIDDAIFKLEPGQVSDVIKTNLGYHIFKAEEAKQERVKTLDEASDEIEKLLYLEKGKVRYNEFIQEIKKNAYISFR